MAEKGHYKTKQRAELLAYLKSMQGDHVTVNDICDHFKKDGINVGTTTVYRRLDDMIDEGVVAKYTIEGTSSACFEYIGEGHQSGNCYHCKCKSCGKIIHLHCEEVEHLGAHLLSEHGFAMDPLRTVFYGLCADCQK